jgi:hypothetical protein
MQPQTGDTVRREGARTNDIQGSRPGLEMPYCVSLADMNVVVDVEKLD